MSLECAYCERDLRGGHSPDCDRPQTTSPKKRKPAPPDLSHLHQISKTMNRTPLEKEIEKKIGDYAKKRGCKWYKFTSPAHRAVPDRIIITPSGVVGFLEIKRGGCKPTTLQMKELKKLYDSGCNVDWCDSVETGVAFINQMLRIPQAPRYHASPPL
jgi:hypothetical protein